MGKGWPAKTKENTTWNTKRTKDSQTGASTILKCRYMFIPVPDLAEVVLKSSIINPRV